MTHCNLFSDKVVVELNVLWSWMKQRVNWYVKGTDIITKWMWGLCQGNTNILKKKCEPCYLSYGGGHRSIFGFSAGVEHSGLFLSTPRNTIGTKECAETSDALPCCGATSPICITQRIKIGSINGFWVWRDVFYSHWCSKGSTLQHFCFVKNVVCICVETSTLH